MSLSLPNMRLLMRARAMATSTFRIQHSRASAITHDTHQPADCSLFLAYSVDTSHFNACTKLRRYRHFHNSVSRKPMSHSLNTSFFVCIPASSPTTKTSPEINVLYSSLSGNCAKTIFGWHPRATYRRYEDTVDTKFNWYHQNVSFASPPP